VFKKCVELSKGRENAFNLIGDAFDQLSTEFTSGDTEGTDHGERPILNCEGRVITIYIAKIGYRNVNQIPMVAD
jgi:hypothetical protein